LASGSGDETICLWDMTTAGTPSAATISSASGEKTAPRLLRSYATKKSPVIGVRFSRRNVLLGAGPFEKD
jgi:hypothetical protein